MSNSTKLSAEALKLAQEYGIDAAKLELTENDLELVRGGSSASGGFNLSKG